MDGERERERKRERERVREFCRAELCNNVGRGVKVGRGQEIAGSCKQGRSKAPQAQAHTKCKGGTHRVKLSNTNPYFFSSYHHRRGYAFYCFACCFFACCMQGTFAEAKNIQRRLHQPRRVDDTVARIQGRQANKEASRRTQIPSTSSFFFFVAPEQQQTRVRVRRRSELLFWKATTVPTRDGSTTHDN